MGLEREWLPLMVEKFLLVEEQRVERKSLFRLSQNIKNDFEKYYI
jgi:hypothetical protein